MMSVTKTPCRIKSGKEESAAGHSPRIPEAKLQMLLGQSGANLDALEPKLQDALRRMQEDSEAGKDSGQAATTRPTRNAG